MSDRLVLPLPNLPWRISAEVIKTNYGLYSPEETARRTLRAFLVSVDPAYLLAQALTREELEELFAVWMSGAPAPDAVSGKLSAALRLLEES